MTLEKAVLNSPVAPDEVRPAKEIKAVISGSDDWYGACSLETFNSSSGLTYTHEDTEGFLNYPTGFNPANFWRKDAGVQVWEYEETYDNWQDTYGMDAVAVFYHSGHGGMDSNGVFQAPLGALWDNRDRAYSSNMAFANEELRYLFWSTCYSLRVSGPDNPVRTWWGPNKGGLRMMFGYETTSVDDPNYGKFFWDEWSKNKTFARAFLDASWRISHNQVPVVMAAGANQSEAINRLNTERLFTKAPVTKGWYQWQWIGTLPTRSFINETTIPTQRSGIILSNKFASDDIIAKLALGVGVTRKEAETILLDANGNRSLSSKDVHTHVTNQGALNIHFGKANVENTSLLNEDKAVKIAQSFINDFELNNGIELALGNTRHKFTCGGTTKGSGTVTTPSAIETIIQFRQTHQAAKSVNSDHGLIAISIDNDGRIVNVYDSTRLVLGETNKLTPDKLWPRDPKGSTGENIDARFKKKIDRIIADGKGKSSVLNEAVGYDFSGNLGSVVHHKEIEVDFGQNLKKRYKVRVPIL